MARSIQSGNMTTITSTPTTMVRVSVCARYSVPATNTAKLTNITKFIIIKLNGLVIVNMTSE